LHLQTVLGFQGKFTTLYRVAQLKWGQLTLCW